MGSKGIVAFSAAMGVLLQQGIGDTIRVSLTPEPRGDRALEVKVAQELLQTMGFRVFVPLVAARSEEHTSELQSHSDLVCRLLLEKKKKKKERTEHEYTT